MIAKHIYITLLFLRSFMWRFFVITRYARRKHLVDVTEIFNQLNEEKTQRFFKLGHLVILILITLFW
ncbi:hypothetical protein Hanom_Chr03g00268721 [Helianthus anomalus]